MKQQYKRRSASTQFVQAMSFNSVSVTSDAPAAAKPSSNFTSLLSSTPSKRRKLSNSSEDAEENTEMVNGSQVVGPEEKPRASVVFANHTQVEAIEAPCADSRVIPVAKKSNKKSKKRFRY